MVLSLSDDKSVYGTLKALVTHLHEEAAEAKRKRDTLSTRTHTWAQYDGAMGAYNLTIAFIQSTDVWRAGALMEEEASKVKHVHARHKAFDEHCMEIALISDLEVNAYLDLHSARSVWEAITQRGISFRQCTIPNCGVLLFRGAEEVVQDAAMYKSKA